MGMFDSFFHPCPKCGKDVVWQSKAGECNMHDYRLGSNPPPPVVAGALNGQSAHCRCGHIMTVTTQVVVTVHDGPPRLSEEDEEEKWPGWMA